ncbi:hypothetical protein BGX34_001592 [Mortierella sp. NVP85]|nr:hypothetical protein BGX34_001592 [Mortierella sp. NVP85]
MELTQLQSYSGPDKAQKCFELARKWRGVVGIPESKQPPTPPPPPPPPPVHDSRKSVDSVSLSSEGTHSIPDQFYPADEASRSCDIDIYEEENSVGNTPGSSKVDLKVPGIDEPNEDQGRPRENYVKHTGCFADAAPRMAHSTKEIEMNQSEQPEDDELVGDKEDQPVDQLEDEPDDTAKIQNLSPEALEELEERIRKIEMELLDEYWDERKRKKREELNELYKMVN